MRRRRDERPWPQLTLRTAAARPNRTDPIHNSLAASGNECENGCVTPVSGDSDITRRGDGGARRRGEGSRMRRAPLRHRIERECEPHGHDEGGNQRREEQNSKPFPHDPHGLCHHDLDAFRARAVRSTVPPAFDEITSDVPRRFCHRHEAAEIRQSPELPDEMHGTALSSAIHAAAACGTSFHKLKTTPASFVLRSTIVTSND